MINEVFALATEIPEEELGLDLHILLIFYAAPTILCYILAKKYNRNKLLWAILGLLFSFFASLILYILSKSKPKPMHIEKSKKNVDDRNAEERIEKERIEKERKENEKIEAERKKSSAQTGSSTISRTNTRNRYAMSILGKWRFGESHNGIFLEFYENETFRFYNSDSSLNFNGNYSLKGDMLSVTVPGMGSDTIKIDEGMGNLNFLGKLFKRV